MYSLTPKQKAVHEKAMQLAERARSTEAELIEILQQVGRLKIYARLGKNSSPDNLTTLCSVHHDLVHQLSLPIDGQVSWLKSPQRAYGPLSSFGRSREESIP